MGAFIYRLVYDDGTPADPPVLQTSVPNWQAGDTIPLAKDRMLRVVETRDGETFDAEPVLIVEEAT
jgi:hypothetical protein